MGEIGVIAGHEVDPTSQPRVFVFVQLARGRDFTGLTPLLPTGR